MKRLVAFVALTALSVAVKADYRPEPWNLEARKSFADQRFGVFIHWGIYANYAQGEWYLQQGHLDEAAYSRMMYGFCPSKFDANEWVRVVKGAGAKYITITSRHHDGFSLWPTKVDDGYNIANTPFKRDILGELAVACRQAGLQLNFYYSLMDWHRTDYPAGSCARSVRGNQPGDYASYKKFMLGQIGELIDNYHPGNIWFDGEWEHAFNKDGKWERTLDWDFDTLYDFIHSKHTLVANNNHQPIRDKEDIQLFERDLPGDNGDGGYSKNQPVINDRPIEQCDVIQKRVWGYRIGEKDFRTAEDVVSMVARAAGKDSNLLMNIGPDGSGQFPAKAVEVMALVGKWFEKNGEAIYGTRGVGFVKNSDGTQTAKTCKGSVLYTITIRNGEFPTVEKREIK
ncbi:MAG: alpha-L-fucosidase [Kiritimatiellae bacterium]|nr:alpha-L-fucosidase [Kiritimatiellia bacterium]